MLVNTAVRSVRFTPVWVAILTALLLVAPVSADEGASNGDPKAGNLVYQSCASCHGDLAQGNDALSAPALAGQQATYLVRQIEHYRNGVRGSGDVFAAQMPPQVAALSAQQIKDVSAFLSGLAVNRSSLAEGDLRLGNNYYHASCGGCHGGKAQGNEKLNAPRLAGLSAGYLKRQFNLFKSGVRGSEPSDKYGRQMKMMAQVLPSDAMLDNVIAYITAQQH